MNGKTKRTCRVFFLTNGNPTKASPRFRVYQLLPHLEQYAAVSVVDVLQVNSLMSPVRLVKAVLSIVNTARKSDVLFIQKLRLPVLFLRALHSLCKIVYDFDDAVFLPPPTWPQGKDFGTRQRRVNDTLSIADVVIAGNEYLATYARQYSETVYVIPTVVDTGQPPVDDSAFSQWGFTRQVFQPSKHKPPHSDRLQPIVVGWIGHPSHVQLLDGIGPALLALQRKHGIKVKVVSSHEWFFSELAVENKLWCLQEEVSDIQTFDIGLMPLTADDPFLRGKCGFKLVEYMATGTPAVASPVGVNTGIIEHGVSGFLASTLSDWQECLDSLIRDDLLRRRMADIARDKSVTCYSIAAVLPKYLAVFDSLTSRNVS